MDITGPWNNRPFMKQAALICKCKGHADHSDCSHRPLLVHMEESRQVIQINAYSRSPQENWFWNISLFLHLNADITNLEIHFRQINTCESLSLTLWRNSSALFHIGNRLMMCLSDTKARLRQNCTSLKVF